LLAAIRCLHASRDREKEKEKEAQKQEYPMGTSIRALLIARMDSFTPSEQKVAQALLDRYPSLGLGPIVSFAKQAEVSDPTVLRFVVRIGYPNYASFQQALHNEIDEAMNSPLARMKAFHSGADKQEGPAPIFERLSHSLNSMIEGLEAETFEQAVSLLADSSLRIYCGGGRYTSPLAAMLAYTLSHVRPHVQHIEPNLKLASLVLVDMGPTDVLVIFDLRRYQKDTISFAKAASELGVRIVLITDEWVSPIGEFAEIVLRIQGRPFAMLETNVPALALSEALVISVTNRQPEVTNRRIKKIESLAAGSIRQDSDYNELLD
jgi:DNA-binding MurR/RpiR family transcriptional regulator